MSFIVYNMSEHIDSLPVNVPTSPRPVDISTMPPIPPNSPVTDDDSTLPPLPLTSTEENLDLHDDVSTLPPVPPSLTEENLDLHNEVIESFNEHKQNVMDESSRLLNEVHESDKLVDEEQQILETEEKIEEEEEEEEHKDSDLVKDVKTLSTLVAFLLSKEETDTMSVIIHSEVKIVLAELLCLEIFYDDVEQLLKDIVHDDKIDAQDVPKLMVLCVRLYEILRSTTIVFDVELCGAVLKTLFDLAIREKIVPIDAEDLELLNCLFDIVDTSVRLLETKTTDKKRKGILHFLSKLFNGCK